MQRLFSLGGPGTSSFVLATGPSARHVDPAAVSADVRISCNSVVRDLDLLRALRPDVICFMDPVFHYGPSRYSAAFRRDLLRAVHETDALLVTYELWAGLLLAHHPELADRLIILRMLKHEQAWHWPTPDRMTVRITGNVLTNAMLPIAFALTDRVEIAGCDGRVADERYFWHHNAKTQYSDELMTSAFDAHPAFFRDRDYADYYEGHCRELEELLSHRRGCRQALRRASRPATSQLCAAAERVRLTAESPAPGEAELRRHAVIESAASGAGADLAPTALGSAVRNSAVYAGAAVFQRGIIFLLLPVYTRVLAPAQYGRLSVLLAIAAAAVILLSCGMDTAFFRTYFALQSDPERQRRFVTTAWTFLLVVPPALAALLALIAYPFLAHSAVVPPAELALALAGAALLVSGTVVPLALLRAEERLRDYLVLAAVTAGTTAAFTLVAVVGLDAGVVGWLVAVLAANALTLAAAVRLIPFRRAPASIGGCSPARSRSACR